MGDPTKTYDSCSETKEQFEARYGSHRPKAITFGIDMVAMSCTCEDGGGLTHWAAILNSPEAIAHHLSHEKCLADLRNASSLNVRASLDELRQGTHISFDLFRDRLNKIDDRVAALEARFDEQHPHLPL